MFLSHHTIEQYLSERKIVIGPDFDKINIRPVGVRVHLGKTLLLPEPNQIIGISEQGELKYKEVDISDKEFVLEPGQFVLGSTFETIKTDPNILTILDGRSTVARLGITTHITASILDGTFEIPHIPTLEIKNVGNFRIKLKFRDPIAMILFAELTEPVTQELQSQYKMTPNTVAPPNLNFKTGKDK